MPTDRNQKIPNQMDSHDHWAKVVLIVVVLVVLVAFILGNRERVRISFVLFHASFSLIWALLVTNLLGFAAGFLMHGRMESRRRHKP